MSGIVTDMRETLLDGLARAVLVLLLLLALGVVGVAFTSPIWASFAADSWTVFWALAAAVWGLPALGVVVIWAGKRTA